MLSTAKMRQPSSCQSVLVLHQQHSGYQACDRRVVVEDAHNADSVFDLLVEVIKRLGAPDLAPVLRREVAVNEVFSPGVGQHVLHGLEHELGGSWEAVGQRGGQVTPAAFDLAGVSWTNTARRTE